MNTDWKKVLMERAEAHSSPGWLSPGEAFAVLEQAVSEARQQSRLETLEEMAAFGEWAQKEGLSYRQAIYTINKMAVICRMYTEGDTK